MSKELVMDESKSGIKYNPEIEDAIVKITGLGNTFGMMLGLAISGNIEYYMEGDKWA